MSTSRRKIPRRLLRKHLPVVTTPLGPLTAGGIDLVAEAWKLKGDLAPTGANGFRAKFIKALAEMALDQPDSARVAHVFRPWVTVDGFLDMLREKKIGGIPKLVLPPKPLPLPRMKVGTQVIGGGKAGHPLGLSKITHTRVWTVLCLSKLAGLTVVAALRKWNEWFPRLSWNELTIESTGRRTFYRDVDKVAAELARLVPLVPPRRRGRPRKPFPPLKSLRDLVGTPLGPIQ